MFTLHELYDSGECFFFSDKTENNLWSLNLRRAHFSNFLRYPFFVGNNMQYAIYNTSREKNKKKTCLNFKNHD